MQVGFLIRRYFGRIIHLEIILTETNKLIGYDSIELPSIVVSRQYPSKVMYQHVLTTFEICLSVQKLYSAKHATKISKEMKIERTF